MPVPVLPQPADQDVALSYCSTAMSAVMADNVTEPLKLQASRQLNALSYKSCLVMVSLPWNRRMAITVCSHQKAWLTQLFCMCVCKSVPSSVSQCPVKFPDQSVQNDKET